MFLLLMGVFLFTPNTYKSTTPVIFVNIRKVKDPDCLANIKQQKAEVNMIANEHVSYPSEKIGFKLSSLPFVVNTLECNASVSLYIN